MTLSRPLALFLTCLAVAHALVIAWMLWRGLWSTALVLATAAAGPAAVYGGLRHQRRTGSH